MAQLAAEDVPKLKLAWAFGFDSVNRAYAQPTIVGARLFIGSANGKVYSLDAKTGCIIWTFEASAPVRTAISIGIDARGWSAYFGDQRANAYALDALSGKLLESANRRASCGNYYGGSRARRPGALCAYHLLRRSDWC
jgi:polyvinyl alcohol dehydrogenase (cytochrome)